jgi:maltose O-acetyltransferase
MTSEESVFQKSIRYISLGIYYTLFRHLPQYLPNGYECRNIRGKLCRHIFQKSGNNINIKKGAFFGSGRNIQIGNNSDIGINCQIFGIDGGGELIIGENVMMAPDVIILTLSHDIRNTGDRYNKSKRKKSKVIIEDGVWIGIRSIIMPGIIIGKNSIVGAGAVVTKDVLPNTIVGGVPARVINTIGSYI